MVLRFSRVAGTAFLVIRVPGTDLLVFQVPGTAVLVLPVSGTAVLVHKARGIRLALTRADQQQGKKMSSFGTYLIGFIVLIVGLAIAAYLLGVPQMWIGVGVIVLIGIGILTGTSRTKTKDPPSTM